MIGPEDFEYGATGGIINAMMDDPLGWGFIWIRRYHLVFVFDSQDRLVRYVVEETYDAL
jgi:hypothetical protein